MSLLTQFIQTGSVNRTRRNHALEHATLRVLGERNRNLMLAGYSDPHRLLDCRQGGHRRTGLRRSGSPAHLHAGEHELAIHPNCGTNFATSGLLAGLAAWLVMLGSGHGFRRKLDQLATVISAVTVALVIAQPLGPRVQRQFTTDAELEACTSTSITVSERNGHPAPNHTTAD